MATATTVDRALDLLFFLNESPGPQGISALARDFGMAKSGVHRLLTSLAKRGLVERTPDARYQVGFGLLSLAESVRERDPLVTASRPEMLRFVSDVKETVFLVTARSGRLVVIEKVEGEGFLRASPDIGSVLPADPTAVGLLYRAFEPDAIDRSECTYGGPSPEEVADVRGKGWAANFDRWQPGLSVVAVPVRVDGRMVGALALGMPSTRIENHDCLALASRLHEAAVGIEGQLGGGL